MYATTERAGVLGSSAAHDGDHGFCTVCGMVWPCSWARRHALPLVHAIPTPRLPTA